MHARAAAVRPIATLAVLVVFSTAHAEDPPALPSPLGVGDVVRIAKLSRLEVVAARARANAAARRPAIVSALDDPEVLPSIDHLSFRGAGANVSLTIQQNFPLSGIRGHRSDAAEADARIELSRVDRIGLDVELDAAAAFWGLFEARADANIIDEEHALADQMVAAATARYAAGTGVQADVLRAQLENARLDGERLALAAEIHASEATLNTSLARAIDAAIPELDARISDDQPRSGAQLADTAIVDRPELRAVRAEVARSEADVSVMRSMYAPMAIVRTGPSYTMSDGWGWTLMVGLSIPLWRDKLHAGVAEARSTVEMANADLDATRRMINGEALAARERVVAARARYLALRDSILPKAHEALAATLAAYSASQLPLVSTIEAAQALWSAERDLIKAQAELGLARARLDRAIGKEVDR